MSGKRKPATARRGRFVYTPTRIFLDCPDRIGVSFPGSRIIVDELKKMQGSKWHSRENHWSVPLGAIALQQILELFRCQHIELDPAVPARLRTNGTAPDYHRWPQPLPALADDIAVLRREMRVRDYSSGTIYAHTRKIRRLAWYFLPRRLRELSDQDIRNYLEYLMTEEKLAVRDVNQTLGTIRFFYEVSGMRDIGVRDIHTNGKRTRRALL